MGPRTRFTLDLEPGFQRRLKVAAARKGISMRTYSIAAIQNRLELDEALAQEWPRFGPEAVDALRRVQAEIFGDRVVPGDTTDLIRELREARSRSL